MKNIYRIIVACLVPLTLLLAQAQTAQGVGYGLTKDAAIEQAKRDAVENGLGAYISSETVVTATSLSDNIYSKAQGFVKKFNIDLIARSHQVVEDGYAFLADHKLVCLVCFWSVSGLSLVCFWYVSGLFLTDL